MAKTKLSAVQNPSVSESDMNLTNFGSGSDADLGGKCNSVPIRVAHETKQELNRILALIVRGGGRKKIKVDTLIRHALGKLKEHDFEELRSKTVSYSELFDREFVRYKAEDADITKDQFLGLVLLGTVKIKALSSISK